MYIISHKKNKVVASYEKHFAASDREVKNTFVKHGMTILLVVECLSMPVAVGSIVRGTLSQRETSVRLLA